MKKWIAFLMVLAIFTGCTGCGGSGSDELDIEPFVAENYDITGSCGIDVMWGYDTETNALTIGGEGTMDNYNEGTAPWDEYREEIESVTILNGVKNVGAYAFHDYKDLTNIVIGSHVREIGSGAFKECNGIAEIALPPSLTKIGPEAFEFCDGLTKVVIPDHVTIIGNSAFFGCSNLSEITLGSSVQTIFERAFADTVISEVFVPESVLSIRDGAFSKCDNLKEITVAFENKNYKDKDGVLYTKDEGVVLQYPCCRDGDEYELPDTVTEIAPYAFCNSLLDEVTLPEGLVSIGEQAFYNSFLRGITIPASVTQIGDWAFAYSQSLSSVTYAPGANVMGHEIFYGCEKLDYVYIPVSMVCENCSYTTFSETDIDHIYYEGTREQWQENFLMRVFNEYYVEFEYDMG